jgi:hypothetical protein
MPVGTEAGCGQYDQTAMQGTVRPWLTGVRRVAVGIPPSNPTDHPPPPCERWLPTPTPPLPAGSPRQCPAQALAGSRQSSSASERRKPHRGVSTRVWWSNPRATITTRRQDPKKKNFGYLVIRDAAGIGPEWSRLRSTRTHRRCCHCRWPRSWGGLRVHASLAEERRGLVHRCTEVAV